MKIIYGVLAFVTVIFGFAILYISTGKKWDYQGIFIGTVLTFAALLLVRLIFSGRDKSIQPNQITHNSLTRGLGLNLNTAKAVLVAVGGGFYVLAISVALSSQAPISSGRGAFITNFVYATFGKEGLIIFWATLGSLLILIAIQKSKSN